MTATQAIVESLRMHYPSLDELLTGAPSEHLDAEAQLIDADAGAELFREGSPCRGFPLVTRGQICVSRRSADGARSVELYRVGPGQICVVSASSLLAGLDFTADGVAVVDSQLVMLSPQLFDRWVAHAPFRRLVFGVFSARLLDLMALIDAVAFQRLDQRLADHLLGHGQLLRTTHQALADELGTVREIVTRLLNRFEEQGLVRLGRERIEVLDAANLRAIAIGRAIA
jgi:CRP/FNR family transcriptional regulator